MSEEKTNKLSEGYDFIEESTSFDDSSLDFKEATESIIVESINGEKTQYKILGKACGVFAPIGEFSRNKRLYSNDLWEKVLEREEFSNRLKNRALFGCIGHEDKKVDDKDMSEGKVSHIVSKLEIREDVKGKPYLYGELDILNTRAGRDLLGIYEGGGSLYVSSRGAGKLHPVPGQNYSMVLPESYYVNTFDIVMNPGFLQAKPVFEGIKENKEEKITEELETTVNENKEITSLKEQVEKLSYIVEKVVNSIQKKEDIKEGNKELTEQQKGALLGLVGYLTESKLSEKDMLEVLEKVKEGLKHE